MKALLIAVLSTLFTLAPVASVHAATPLDIGGKVTLVAGAGLFVFDIYKVRQGRAWTEKAKARLNSSQSFKNLSAASAELKNAQAELEAFMKANPEAQASVMQARVTQAESARNHWAKEVLERDILRFDPLAAGHTLPSGVQEARTKVLTQLDETQARLQRFSKYRRLLGLGMFVGGSVVIFMTVSESQSSLSPSAAFEALPSEAKDQLAMEIEDFVDRDYLSMDDIVDMYP